MGAILSLCSFHLSADQEGIPSALEVVWLQLDQAAERILQAEAQVRTATDRWHLAQRELAETEWSLGEAKSRLTETRERIVEGQADKSESQDMLQTHLEHLLLSTRPQWLHLLSPQPSIQGTDSPGRQEVLEVWTGWVEDRDRFKALTEVELTWVEEVDRTEAQLITREEERAESRLASEVAGNLLSHAREEVGDEIATLRRERDHLEEGLDAETILNHRGARWETPILWPAEGRLTDNYGWRTHPIQGTRKMHTGQDIAAPVGVSPLDFKGAPVLAAETGRVQHASRRGGYGNLIIIAHAHGYRTYYAHLDAILVIEGQAVMRGQQIGKVGTTGNSTGNHLHFEVRQGEVHEDPQISLPPHR